GTWFELLRPARDHVEVAVQDDAWDRGLPALTRRLGVRTLARRRALARRSSGPHLGHQHGQAVVIVVAHFDVAGFEPALDKSCGGHQLLGPRGVVRNQALCENALINHGARIGPGISPLRYAGTPPSGACRVAPPAAVRCRRPPSRARARPAGCAREAPPHP